MFRKGGSAEGGITSGLQSPRQGYAQPGSVQQNDSSRQRIINAMGAAPPRRNFNDFLINFGLDIASRSPQGNIFQTAALSAQDPYDKFSKARNADSNLMRQVGMESEIMDINKENAAAAAQAERDFKGSQLDKKIQADKDIYNLERADNINNLIDSRAQNSIAENVYNNYTTAKNEAEWVFKKSKEYKNIGGVLTQNQIADNRFAKKQGKKNGVGKIYYDPFNDRVMQVAVVEGEYILQTVDGPEQIIEKTTITEQPKSADQTYREKVGKSLKEKRDKQWEKIRNKYDFGDENAPAI
jgi:hypothetical protein